MKQYQKLHTENVYTAGLTQYPGALIINKRFSNIPPGAPIFMFNWAEDNIIRERVFVPRTSSRAMNCIPTRCPVSRVAKAPWSNPPRHRRPPLLAACVSPVFIWAGSMLRFLACAFLRPFPCSSC